MGRARSIADRLDHPAIEADRGAYFLGATAPDIRVITRRDRRVTHFFHLDRFEHQDSVRQMLVEHPDLCDAAALDPRTRAFVAGYITHLVLDEVYIETIYRLFFGAKSEMAEDAIADVLDRALQFEMNRRELEDGDALTHITSALQSCETSNAVAFIEDEYLAQWREVILDFASQGPTWDRFPRMMNMHLKRSACRRSSKTPRGARPRASRATSKAATREPDDGNATDRGCAAHRRGCGRGARQRASTRASGGTPPARCRAGGGALDVRARPQRLGVRGCDHRSGAYRGRCGAHAPHAGPRRFAVRRD
jgi:hypothetical protein